jgi:4'-phosphopantetheinyl transferase EntD
MDSDPPDVMQELSGQLVALAKAAHPTLLIGCRAIQPGDEHALSPEEAAALGGAVSSVRRASGAARIVARGLLSRLCAQDFSLPRTASGAPRWPCGFVGSMTHDSRVAVVAVAPAAELASIGVDVEPACPLPYELLELVAKPSEVGQLHGDPTAARLLFCIKEAAYKASYPLDRVFLEHHDVEVRLLPRQQSSVARTSTGRVLYVHTRCRPRLLALAVVPRET